MTQNSVLSRLVVFVALAGFSISATSLASATTVSGSLTADNAFFAWVSPNNSTLGTLVASGNNWPTTFSFSGAALTPGVTNYLQIEVINYGLQGGFIGDFTLSDTGFHFANGTQSISTETADWSGIYNSSNSTVAVQPWVQPTGGTTSFGANGVSPWGTRPGISAGANWIWPNDANSLPGGSACGNCTVDLSLAILPASSSVPEPGSLLIFGSGVLALAGVLRRKLMP